MQRYVDKGIDYNNINNWEKFKINNNNQWFLVKIEHYKSALKKLQSYKWYSYIIISHILPSEYIKTEKFKIKNKIDIRSN